jgi:hypothetical protein
VPTNAENATCHPAVQALLSVIPLPPPSGDAAAAARQIRLPAAKTTPEQEKPALWDKEIEDAAPGTDYC